jgi:hypothetical protein
MANPPVEILFRPVRQRYQKKKCAHTQPETGGGHTGKNGSLPFYKKKNLNGPPKSEKYPFFFFLVKSCT